MEVGGNRQMGGLKAANKASDSERQLRWGLAFLVACLWFNVSNLPFVSCSVTNEAVWSGRWVAALDVAHAVRVSDDLVGELMLPAGSR